MRVTRVIPRGSPPSSDTAACHLYWAPHSRPLRLPGRHLPATCPPLTLPLPLGLPGPALPSLGLFGRLCLRFFAGFSGPGCAEDRELASLPLGVFVLVTFFSIYLGEIFMIAWWLKHMHGSHEVQGSNPLAGTLGPSLACRWGGR